MNKAVPLIVVIVAVVITIPTAASSRNKFKCRGRVGDCIGWDSEAAMGSEISHRVLQQAAGRYISYDALKQDNVPCNQRGASYYNCQPSSPVNPYQRGCTVITHCYRFTG